MKYRAIWWSSKIIEPGMIATDFEAGHLILVMTKI
jgi:hypothetical protein